MTTLTREAILAAQDLVTETVKVPEWGGEVIISAMTAETRDAWEQSLIGAEEGARNIGNVRARLFAATAVSEKGERLFTDADAAALGRKSAKAMERCVKVAQRLNGLTAREVEDARKN